VRRIILAVDGSAWALHALRGPLLEALVHGGHEVHACAPIDATTREMADYDVRAAFEAAGIRFHEIRMDRQRLSPRADLRALMDIRSVVRSIAPHILVLYSMKSCLYGSIAGHRVPERYCAMTGLGYLFHEESGLQRLVKPLLRWPLRQAVRGSRRVFVQNPDDRDLLLAQGFLRNASQAVVVNGSGVDPARFERAALPDGPLTFLTIARLHRHKGVLEYAEAARLVKRQHPDVRFLLVGPRDRHPSALTDSEVSRIVSDGAVEWLGGCRDVRPFIRQCHVFVLPSYREGTSRSMLEAMSMGRAVIGADAPGCREPIEDGRSGFLVPVRDARGLAEAMERFVAEPALAQIMGDRGRAIVQERYDVGLVVAQMLEAMHLGPDSETAPPQRPFLEDAAKRLGDIVLAAAGLCTLWPVLAATAIAVKLDSPGPVFYRGVRTGLGGTPFRIYKFRTMVVDAEKMGGPSTGRSDPRVTRVGAILRRTKLDELPQLINVLLGDMSFVGPRPEVPEYTRLYRGEEAVILSVRPGITDLASIRFANMDEELGDEDPDRVYRERVMPVKNALRVKYVEERSLLGDARILLQTAARLGSSVFSRKNGS